MNAFSSPRTALRIAVVAGVAGSLALVAAIRAPSLASAPATNTITITANEYSFVAPDTIVGGVTTIRLLNRGRELHHVELIRLAGTHTLKDFLDALAAGGPPPVWAAFAGGPNAPAPGGDAVATIDLAPGHYALLCFIPSADGKPHFMKGMAKAVTVVTAGRGKVSRAGSTRPTSTMTLTDYRFILSKPLVAGLNTVRVRNVARQPHEVQLVKLAPGKSAHDMVAWVEKQAGPPPGLPMGGVTGIATGASNDFSVTLTPGDYALLCFLPDAKDGRMHAEHGMIAQFAVR